MAKTERTYIIDKDGRKISIILPIEDYKKLLEEIHDLEVVLRRRNEPEINLEDLKESLKHERVL